MTTPHKMCETYAFHVTEPLKRSVSDPLPLEKCTMPWPADDDAAYEASRKAAQRLLGSPITVSSNGEEMQRLVKKNRSQSSGQPHSRRPEMSHMNVYTQCGRHGDDWLFGGFSVSQTVKRMWDRKA